MDDKWVMSAYVGSSERDRQPWWQGMVLGAAFCLAAGGGAAWGQATTRAGVDSEKAADALEQETRALM